MAANGLAAGLLAFAARHHRPHQQAAGAPCDMPDVSRSSTTSASAHKVERRKQSGRQRVPAGGEHAARFAVEALELTKDGAADLMDILAAYRLWCQRTGATPLTEANIGAALAALFEGAGIVVAKHGDRFLAMGIALSQAPHSQYLPIDARGREN